MLWLFVNLETCLLCLLGLTPGAIYWPQSALSATSADRFYRIDKAQEHLHFVTEICQDEVFILDHEGPVVSQGASTGMPDLVVEPTAGYVSVFRILLLTAASTGDLSMLSECVRRGVSLLVRDSGGCSALHIAAQNGHADLVSYILQQGEDEPDQAEGDSELASYLSTQQHTSSANREDLETAV
ncbi:Diacylglycerol kinase zeta [Nibea albiflora]|uniref:Diacylglycerol kinase zeta n=1 Tax=Nibea albiflora TaxID=240163 RepID=A0ACB7ETZ4_NIBAL|nr:Diacylglycerol kinase zeta [Nibea albiflora]